MPNSRQILVVEDEEHLAVGIKYNLQAEGYRVTTVGDGPSALEQLRPNCAGVDLVILDVMLPGMSGYAVCEQLRDMDSEIPVLILSARTLPEDRARGFDVGANQYLTKPFELDELLSRVNNLIKLREKQLRRDRDHSAPPGEYRFDNAVVNFDTFEVLVDDQPVRLTKQELQVLRYFVENEARVISRAEMLENIWGMPGHLQSRAPDQFVSRLRKAFEPDPSHPRYFLTVREAGYRFVSGRDVATSSGGC